MGLKRMLAGLGAGGASVETVLQDPNCRPGGTIAGICYLSGGNVDQTIEKVDVELVAKVEVEYDAGDSEGEYMTTTR